MQGRWQIIVVTIVGFGLAALLAGQLGQLAHAETSESSSYQATDLQFGAVSDESCSDAYCAETTLGEAIIGDSANDVMSAQFGDSTDDDPRLEVIVANGDSKMGVLATDRTATKLMLVRVRGHHMDGYTVTLEGEPPKAGQHVLKAPDSPTSSKSGKEQFAVNLVKNSSPKVGRDPERRGSDDSQLSAVLDDYRTPDKFMYKTGETVIDSSVGTARVDYVVSMIVNISSDTPPGQYAGVITAVVTPYY